METRIRTSTSSAFLKSAVAIGGTSALSACLEREGTPATGAMSLYDNFESPYPDRQHAFASHLVLDPHGNTLLPMHHALVLLNYQGDTPTDDGRTRVENAFRTLENAYDWVAENQSPVGDPALNEGLLFAVGYSPYFFDLFGEGPDSPAIDAGELVGELAPLGGDTTPDTYDPSSPSRGFYELRPYVTNRQPR